MNKELAKTLTLALVNYLDENRPEGTMDCSSGECVSLEKAFTEENFDSVETLINKKLSRLTEFEKAFIERVFHQKVEDLDEENKEIFREDAHLVLALAREQLIKDGYVIEKKAFHDAVEKIDPEVMKEVSDNVDKENELAKKHLEGYIKGREDTLREMKNFIESLFKTKKVIDGKDGTDFYPKEYTQPLCLRNGGVCTNPMRDCINCTPTLERFNTASGTSTATLHGNTSATDGKEHNPSFID